MKRKILTVLVGLMVACGAMAQEQAFGLQVGYAQPTLREPKAGTYSTKDFSNKTLYKGFNVGLAYEGTIIQGFGTFFSVNYTFGADAKEWKSMYPNQMVPRSRDKASMHSLSVRSDWQYKFTVAKETYLLLYTGPVIGVNLSMKNTKEIEVMNSSMTKVDHVDKVVYNRLTENNQELYPQLLRYNIQWGVGAGFQYQRYYIRGGYDFGITNEFKYKYMTEVEGQTLEMRNRCRLDNWHVSLGIYLWQN